MRGSNSQEEISKGRKSERSDGEDHKRSSNYGIQCKGNSNVAKRSEIENGNNDDQVFM